MEYIRFVNKLEEKRKRGGIIRSYVKEYCSVILLLDIGKKKIDKQSTFRHEREFTTEVLGT